jgi:putative DNA methylase
LEAQRLGLEAHASDLNPVAVLINKAMIEIPPEFAGQPPVNPEINKSLLQREWRGVQGLADDVRYYGKWMRDEAWKRIGHLYPRAELPKEYGGGEATVIAWLWARTVTCPNPACGGQMPLVSKFWLSTKKEKEAWANPIIDRNAKAVCFEVKYGLGAPEGTVNRLGARCIICGVSVSFEHVRAEGRAGHMGTQLTAIVAEGKGGRVYLSPNKYQESIAVVPEPEPEDILNTELPEQALGFRVQLYGMTRHRDLFTSRQLTALTTFSDLISEVSKLIRSRPDANEAYANAVATYLALAIDKAANLWSCISSWMSDRGAMRETFARQAISMMWDFAEANPFSDAGGNFSMFIDRVADAVQVVPATSRGISSQEDAASSITDVSHPVLSTDPPYYDNVGYADLSDFFYVWLRRSVGRIYPGLFSTLLVPKAQELIATPYRFSGNKDTARRFFEERLHRAFALMHEVQNSYYPLTVYYAFKQAESEQEENGKRHGPIISASTGWETMLEGLLQSSFAVTGTWPMRTEGSGRLRQIGSNALASSIVLVCRPRPVDAPLTTRRDFLNTLKRELPKALKDLQRGNIAPVDLAQAAIGPGMAVFSRYSKVLESDGTPMRIRTALQLINQTLDEVLAEQEGEYDADTRWAISWFEQYGIEEGPYGVAETLSKAKNTAISALVEAGILRAQGGKVRLLRRDEFSSDWNPTTAKRLTVWEVTQRLIRELQEHGETGAASILDHVGANGEVARDLAYRLYIICERKKWADEALAYNSLVVEWFDISGAVEQLRRTTAEQAPLFS